MHPGREAAIPPPSREVEQLLTQVRDEHEMYLRALADFENYRRRAARENESAIRNGKQEIILALLDVIDSFDLARKHLGEAPPAVFDGVLAIYGKLQRLLELQGVTPFASKGQLFDPSLHEAIASVDTTEFKPGTVVEEMQRGYRWGSELLRPARVRVARSQ